MKDHNNSLLIDTNFTAIQGEKIPNQDKKFQPFQGNFIKLEAQQCMNQEKTHNRSDKTILLRKLYEKVQ